MYPLLFIRTTSPGQRIRCAVLTRYLVHPLSREKFTPILNLKKYPLATVILLWISVYGLVPYIRNSV